MYNRSNVESSSMLKSDESPRCDLTFALLAAMKSAVDNGAFSRPMVIDRMNECLGGEKVITRDMFNKWFSVSAPTKFPAEYLPAFCWATQSIEPFVALLLPLDYSPVDGRALTMVNATELAFQAQALLQQSETMFANIMKQAAQATPQQSADITRIK
ncbi:hypothetical protein L1285_20915 [Pseudoalteromonas sp. DL2-H2.2]|uniref:hypothetical protein n=1 Tax=Pseudoalteromonas sp. DL2-H2.2 TaxID=2908889 RepID=UPI001F40C8DA|nr:hypothetical protein [Pseudoalteromonas sp. DL2-H2.2]MCF2910773.1 hypothetical protein [Pseudoalteromonas sp. DL2-H2.2]